MNKTLKAVLLVLAVLVVGLGAFAGGFVAGHVLPFGGDTGLGFSEPVTEVPPPTTSPEQQAATPEEMQALFAPFWEAWTLVHENYVDQPVDDVALMRGAIDGTGRVGRYSGVELEWGEKEILARKLAV